MANILISYISLLNREGMPLTYSTFLDDGTTVSGRQTNEAGTKTILKMLDSRGEKLDRMICLCSKNVKEDEIVFNPEKNCIYPDEPCSAVSYEYFKNSIEMYSESVLGKSLPVNDFFRTVDVCDDFEKYVPEVLKHIKPGDSIYIDTTGGFRDAIIYLQLIMNLLKCSGIKIEMMIYSKIAGKNSCVMKMSGIEMYYDILDGVNEFVTSGKSRLLESFARKYAGQVDNTPVGEFISRAGKFADSLQLCDLSRLTDITSDIYQTVEKIEKIEKPDSVESIFQNILPVVKNKFVSDCSDYCSIIEWCLDNELVQQALTIYIEKIPEILFDTDKGYITAPKPLENARKEALVNPSRKNIFASAFYEDFMECCVKDTNIFKEIKRIADNFKDISGHTDFWEKQKKSDYDEVNNFVKVFKRIYSESRCGGEVKTSFSNTEYDLLYIDVLLFVSRMNRDSEKGARVKFKPLLNMLTNNYSREFKIMLGISSEKKNTFDKKLENYRFVNNRMAQKAGFTVKNLELLKPVMLDYILAKAFRNQINHASDEENLTDDQKKFFEDMDYAVDLNVSNIRRLLNKAVKNIKALEG